MPIPERISNLLYAVLPRDHSVMRDVFDCVDLMAPLPSYTLSRPAEAILLWRRVRR